MTLEAATESEKLLDQELDEYGRRFQKLSAKSMKAIAKKAAKSMLLNS